jgi:CheY-like chemotaxis protein
VDAVTANEELDRRPSRAPDPQANRRGLALLAEELAGSPRHVLQKLTDVALELCRAHSAGVSLVEEEGGRRILRWHAVSGKMRSLLWGTMPRDDSPCGTVLERGSAQLMVLPDRQYAAARSISPRILEALLTPFSVGDEIVGTVWIVSHRPERKFDREDLRVLSSLASFASSAYQRLSSLSADEVLTLARLNKARAMPGDAPRRGLQRRVLVVDDHVDAARALELLLSRMGHSVDVAHNGQAAVRMARAARPDIVLLDLNLPDMSGHTVARQLREFLGNTVHIVAVTGFGSEEDRHEAIEAGIDQHIVKPIDLNVLKSLVG